MGLAVLVFVLGACAARFDKLREHMARHGFWWPFAGLRLALPPPPADPPASK